jgi:hypothetical protein
MTAQIQKPNPEMPESTQTAPRKPRPPAETEQLLDEKVDPSAPHEDTDDEKAAPAMISKRINPKDVPKAIQNFFASLW